MGPCSLRLGVQRTPLPRGSHPRPVREPIRRGRALRRGVGRGSGRKRGEGKGARVGSAGERRARLPHTAAELLVEAP